LFPEEWDVLEVAAMSLAFEDTMTALDLLANAVYVACGGTPSASGAYKDLGYWTPTRIAAVTQANTKRWLDAVTTSADLSLLKTCRDALTHRSVTRLVSMGGGVGRSVVEIAERPVPGSAATAPLGGIDVLIPNVLTFGEQQLQACSAALRADFGT
jgi:hypothetical protein